MDYNNVDVIVLKMIKVMMVMLMMMIDAHFQNGNIIQLKNQVIFQMKCKIGKMPKLLVYYIKRKRKQPIIQNLCKVIEDYGGKELPMKILNKIKLMILMLNSMVLTVSTHKDPQKILKIDLL